MDKKEYAEKVVRAYGGATKMGKEFGMSHNTIQSWISFGMPSKWILSHGKKFNAKIRAHEKRKLIAKSVMT